MSDWTHELSDDERESWESFVEHFRRDALEKIAGTDLFLSILPTEEFSVQFATELGTAIMLNKPLVIVASRGVAVPPVLQRLALEIVYADVDTEAGQAQIHSAIKRLTE